MTEEQMVTVFVDAWRAWSKRPGDERSTRAKEAAARDLVGESATALLAHVADACRTAADPWERVRPAAVEFLTSRRATARDLHPSGATR